MLLDLAQPVALLLSILSLYATFHAAFLVPASPVGDRLQNALVRLACAGAISLIAGMLFREAELQTEARFDADFHAWFGGQPRPTLARPLHTTLPVQLFCWTTAVMAVLFTVSWYIETYYIPYSGLYR